MNPKTGSKLIVPGSSLKLSYNRGQRAMSQIQLHNQHLSAESVEFSLGREGLNDELSSHRTCLALPKEFPSQVSVKVGLQPHPLPKCLNKNVLFPPETRK